jgi:hypothetical protein
MPRERRSLRDTEVNDPSTTTWLFRRTWFLTLISMLYPLLKTTGKKHTPYTLEGNSSISMARVVSSNFKTQAPA